jgi:hypothetical protein
VDPKDYIEISAFHYKLESSSGEEHKPKSSTARDVKPEN